MHGPSARGPHRLADVLVCPRKWTLRYLRKIVPLHDRPRRLAGTLFHIAVAYRNASMLSARSEWMKVPLRARLEQAGEGFPHLVPATLDLLRAYESRYPRASDPHRPVAVEEEFTLRLPNGETATCRTDCVYEVNGKLWVKDYKTTRGGWGKQADRLPAWNSDGEYALDWQLLICLHAARQRFGADRVRGLVVERVKNIAPYDFSRDVVDVPALTYAETLDTAQAACAAEKTVLRVLLSGEKPAAHQWACWGRWGACDYRPLCLAPTVEARKMLLRTEFAKIEEDAP